MAASIRSERLRTDVLSVLTDSVREKIFPGALAAVISDHDALYAAYGNHTYDPGSQPISGTSIFDVASLTKVVATTTAIMQLAERKRLDLNDRACKFLTGLSKPPRDQITIFQLLAHMAGFPGGEPLPRDLRSREDVLQAIFSIDLSYPPGMSRIYDDLGFILLALIVESIAGVPFDEYCRTQIFEPLGMTETIFNPAGELSTRVVPTEIDASRGGLVRGTVHDERAYLLGGVAGHAGIFTTAQDLARFSRALMAARNAAPSPILSTASVKLMWALQWQDSDGEYGLGWDRLRPSYMNGIDDSTAVGHTGFTGVSMVISPKRNIAMVLLSNRVHPVRSSTTLIGRARQKFVQAVITNCPMS